MPRLLKYGLIGIGSGIPLVIVAIRIGFGSCSDGTGLLAMIAGQCLLFAGTLLSIAAGVVAIIKRKPKPIA